MKFFQTVIFFFLFFILQKDPKKLFFILYVSKGPYKIERNRKIMIQNIKEKSIEALTNMMQI